MEIGIEDMKKRDEKLEFFFTFIICTKYIAGERGTGKPKWYQQYVHTLSYSFYGIVHPINIIWVTHEDDGSHNDRQGQKNQQKKAVQDHGHQHPVPVTALLFLVLPMLISEVHQNVPDDLQWPVPSEILRVRFFRVWVGQVFHCHYLVDVAVFNDIVIVGDLKGE